MGKPLAVAYVRVSSEEQVSNNSLDTQERECRGYVNRQGWKLARIFRDEGESAKTLNRPALRELAEYCRKQKGKVEFVVVWKLDRLARNQHDFHCFKALLASFGVAVRSATEVIEDDPAGRLLEGILAAFGQFENDVKAERTTMGMKAAARDGQWCHVAPIGYLNTRDSAGKATLVIDPERGPLVRKAFEMLATGIHSKAEVLRKITDLGLRSRRGNPVCSSSFDRMVGNVAYAGWIKSSFTGHEPVRANFPPLVEQELFDRVQAVISGRAYVVTPHLRNRPDFPLRRFVRCGACGQPVTASWSTGRNGEKYGYYRCHRCGGVKVRKGTLEQQFLDLLEQLEPMAEWVSLFRDVVLDEWRQQHAGAVAEHERMQRRVGELEGQKQRLLDLLLDGTVDKPTYAERREQLEIEIAVARSEANDANLDTMDLGAVLDFAEHLVCNARKMWIHASLDERQRLQGVLFPEGLSHDGEGFGNAVTGHVFSYLRRSEGDEGGMGAESRSAELWKHANPSNSKDLEPSGDPKSRVVTPTGFEPVFQA